MLFRQPFLVAISTGAVTLAFRRWRRPSVKAGGTLRTAVGVLEILEVEKVDLEATRAAEARAAGFATLAELHQDLAEQRPGDLYRIRFRWAGADPRITLRQNDQLSEADLASLAQRLARLDRNAAWTTATLRTLAAHEGRRAGDLARLLGRDKDQLKLDIRKLKNLGLTESLETGYRLSPRGVAYLRHLAEEPGDRPSGR